MLHPHKTAISLPRLIYAIGPNEDGSIEEELDGEVSEALKEAEAVVQDHVQSRR